MALLCHRLGEIIHSTETDERCGFCICPAATRTFFFRSQVGQMIGKFVQIPPHMPWRYTSPQQAFAKFIEWLRYVALLSAFFGLRPPGWSKTPIVQLIDVILWV